MSIYAIGDVQGCFSALQTLVQKINFDPNKDQLWFTGDLVNRGPDSLAVLNYVKALGDKQITVLGNHDLHLLAVFYGVQTSGQGDTLNDILSAPEGEELMQWLRMQPLLHHDVNNGFTLVHAGIAPFWDLAKARTLASEVEHMLRGKDYMNLLKNMYSNVQNIWQDDLSGIKRRQTILNYFTRMRYCYADGRLDFAFKGQLADKPTALQPWYEVAGRKNQAEKIIFGHWSALQGKISSPNLYPLDTGCVWGKSLTALRLEDYKYFKVSCA